MRDPLERGDRLSSDMTRPVLVRRWATERFEAAQQPASTVGAEAEVRGQKLEEEVFVGAWRAGRSLHRSVVRLAEGDTAAREQSSPAAVGEEPVVPDANEALRENVKQEPATELGELEREGPGPATTVVIVAEGHDQSSATFAGSGHSSRARKSQSVCSSSTRSLK